MAHTNYARILQRTQRQQFADFEQWEKERDAECHSPCYAILYAHRYEAIEATFKGTNACYCVDFVTKLQSIPRID